MRRLSPDLRRKQTFCKRAQDRKSVVQYTLSAGPNSLWSFSDKNVGSGSQEGIPSTSARPDNIRIYGHNMTNENIRWMMTAGVFMPFPTTILGLMLSLNENPIYQFVFVLSIFIALLSINASFVVSLFRKCPNCLKRYFIRMPLLLPMRRCCVNCRYRDA